jgi:hypothetical protein
VFTGAGNLSYLRIDTLRNLYPPCKTLSVVRSSSCSLGWFPGHAGTAFDPYRSHRRTTAAREGFDPMPVYVADRLAERGSDSLILQHDQDGLDEPGLTQKFAEWRKPLQFNALAAGA